MSTPNIETGVYGNGAITASTNVSAQRSRLIGIFVASASSTPTITVYDSAGTATTTTVVGVFTPAAATWYRLPFLFKNGIYIAIGGTVNCTPSFEGS